MTTKMTQADFDAMFEAAAAAGLVADVVHDPKAAKLQRDQDTARLSVEAEEERREPSLGEKATAAATGVAESATAGLSPYSWGAMKALAGGDYFTALPIGEIPKRFREGVAEQKESIDFATEGKRQAAFGAGHLAADVGTAVSGVAAPVKSAIGAGKAIAGGAPASSVLKTGMRPMIDRVRGALAEPLTAMGSQADEARVLTTMGATGASMNAPAILREAERFPGGVPALAEKLRSTGISKGLALTSGIAKRSEALQKSAGELIGDQIARATKKGGVVDAKALAARLRADASGATGGLQSMLGDPKTQAAYLNDLADQLDALAPTGVAKLQDVKDLSVGTGQQAASAYKRIATDKNVPGEGLALMDARRAYEDAIAKGIEKTGVATPEAVQAAKSDYQAALMAGEAAETSLGKAGKRGPFGLITAEIGQKSVPAAVAYHIARPAYASGRATALEAARSLGKAVAPALTSAQTATVQRALAAGNTPQMVAQAMQLPLDAIEAIAIGTAVKPSSAFALGKSALTGQAEGDRLEAMRKRLAAP